MLGSDDEAVSIMLLCLIFAMLCVWLLINLSAVHLCEISPLGLPFSMAPSLSLC